MNKNKIINKELLDSGDILRWLQKQDQYSQIIDSSFSTKFTELLNKAYVIYTKYFWLNHKKVNEELLGKHIKAITEIEQSVIEDLKRLSGSAIWENKVRVDLTTYGNWAGAYSLDFYNVIISSIDPIMLSSAFVEVFFHEGSHLMFLRSSPFRKILFDSFKLNNTEYPKGLWHACMFYLSGLSVKKQLYSLGIEHVFLMETKNIVTSQVLR